MKILIAVDGSACALAAIEGLQKRRDWFRGPEAYALIYWSIRRCPTSDPAAWAGKEAIHSYYEEESDAATGGGARPARTTVASRT